MLRSASTLLLVLALPSFAYSQGTCGTGGPGGNFDWVIPAGTTLILDTTSDVILGGPGGQQVVAQTVIGGVVEVRDLIVEPGARLLFQGPNAPTILASRDVDVDGWIALDGRDAAGVGTLNTTNQPELGAPGHAGGGVGGTGSFLTNQSTPSGGAGGGPFGLFTQGGLGGETGYSILGKNARRGAGGGGGRFGADLFVELNGVRLKGQNMVGMDAESGFAGGPEGLGAVSQNRRAAGGAMGPVPFQNSRPGDDFLGTLETPDGTQIQGELVDIWAGSGGGAGGDAVNSDSFPLVPFVITGDEKGAGGGAGAGSLVMLIGGDLRVGVEGRITADGGDGGGGENTLFFDRVGGGSGGGSGGHLVLQAEGQMSFEGQADGAGDLYDDLATGDRARPISALGGQGGAGQNDQGGARVDGPSPWRCDAIPYGAFVQGVVTPPLDDNCFRVLPGVGFGGDDFDWDDPNSVANPGTGGDGGPGLVQLHVDSDIDLLFPAAVGQDLTKVFAPPPVGWSNGRFRGLLRPDLCTTLPASWGGSSPPAPTEIELGTPSFGSDWLSGWSVDFLR